MNSPHWTDLDLLNHLYGVGPQDGHLGGCSLCRERWLSLAEARQTALAAERNEVPADLLVRQREAVMRRIGRRQAVPLRFASALAGIAVLGAGLLFLVPGEKHPSAADQSLAADAQLFSELSAAASRAEPRASEPMQALFEFE